MVSSWIRLVAIVALLSSLLLVAGCREGCPKGTHLQDTGQNINGVPIQQCM